MRDSGRALAFEELRAVLPEVVERRKLLVAIARGTKAIEWLHEFDPQASQEELRGLLGQMLFSGEDALKPTNALSGGEAARLIFCRLMLQKPNFLVLDEQIGRAHV